MSIDIINGVASDPAWEDKGLEERNEALAKAFDADRDAKDLRSDEQKELDSVNTQSAEGFGMMLGQGGESAADFTPSGFVAQDVINSYSDTQRDVAVVLNTSIYQKNNADPSVRGNYEEMSKAVSDYMDGEQTPEDARMMALRMSAESLKINKVADKEMEMQELAAAHVNDWLKVDDHSSPVTSFISGVTEAAQQGVAAGLSALDPDVRSGDEPAYESEATEFRESYKATRDEMLRIAQDNNPDLFGPDIERIVDTHIADAKLDAEKFEGKAILNSKGDLITKSSFYLLDDSEQNALLGGLGLSKHKMREFNETKDFMSERVMEKYREAASYIPLDFESMGDGDLDQGIKNFVASDGMKGTMLKGAGKAGARLSDFLAGATRLVSADEYGEEFTKQAAAGRLMAGQIGGNELVADVLGVTPDLFTSRLGGKAMMKLSKTGKAGSAAGATAEQIKAAQKVSVYGSAIGSGAGVGLGVFGESMSAGNSYAKSLLLAGEGMAITAGITTIGGVSGFEAMTAGALGAKSVMIAKLRANTTFNEAVKLRWGQMNAIGKSVAHHSYREYFEEQADEWLQSIAVSKQLYPDLTIQDHAEMAWHAGKVGAAIGGVVGSVAGLNQVKAFNEEFKDVRNKAKLSDIAANRDIAKEVETTVNDLVEFGAPITAGALTDKVINDAKQQNDEREAKIEAETGKAGIAQRIITKLGDVAAGRTGESNIKDDVVGRQKARVEQSRDVAIKADEAYRDNPSPENQAKLSAANLNYDTQVEVSKKILGGLTAKNQTAGETSTSETLVEDEPGKAIPENQAVDEFNEVKPPPVNERKVEEQRQADEERAAADAAADAAAGNQATQPAKPDSKTYEGRDATAKVVQDLINSNPGFSYKPQKVRGTKDTWRIIRTKKTASKPDYAAPVITKDKSGNDIIITEREKGDQKVYTRKVTRDTSKVVLPTTKELEQRYPDQDTHSERFKSWMEDDLGNDFDAVEFEMGVDSEGRTKKVTITGGLTPSENRARFTVKGAEGDIVGQVFAVTMLDNFGVEPGFAGSKRTAKLSRGESAVDTEFRRVSEQAQAAAQAANQPAPTAPVTPVAKPKKQYKMKQKPTVASAEPEVTTTDDAVDEQIIESVAALVTKEKKASVSLVQRKLKIGYTKAAVALETLERRGLVGPQIGAKPRQVFAPAVDPAAASKAIFNTKRESYKTDDEYKKALTDGVGNLVRSIAPNINVDVVIDNNPKASAHYKPNINPETKEITGGTITVGRNYKETLKKRYAHLKRKDGDEDFEIHTMRMAIDEEVRHHGALVSVGYKGLVEAGTNILADPGALAVAKLYDQGKLIKEDGSDYTESEKITIAAEVYNTLGQRIAHGHSTVDIIQSLNTSKSEGSNGTQKFLEGLKVYLSNLISSLTGNKKQANVAPEIMEQVQRIEAFLKTDFGYGGQAFSALNATTEQQAINEANDELSLGTPTNAVDSRISDDRINSTLQLANSFTRAVRRDGIDVAPGFFRFNEATMQLEVAVGEDYDGYGETRYGLVLPGKALINRMVAEFNKRNNIGALNAKWQASVKHNSSKPLQEAALAELKTAIKANLNLVQSRASVSDFLKKRVVPVRDDTGQKRSLIDVFTDNEAIALSGQLDIRSERNFYRSNNLKPKIGTSSRNHARVDALMYLYEGRFTAEKIGHLKNFADVQITPNTNVLLDARAAYEAVFRTHLPGATRAMLNSLPSSVMNSSPDIKEFRQLRDLLIKNKWLREKTNNTFTLPPKAKARWQAEYIGRGRTDVGSSLLLLNGKVNDNGTVTLDLRAPDYLTEAQKQKYHKTRASNIVYTTATATARRMAQSINNGSIDVRVYDRIKMGDAAAALFIGTDFEVDHKGHPYIQKIEGAFVNNTGKPGEVNEDGSNKPIPMPKFNLDSWGDVNMDWLDAAISFFTAVEQHASRDDVDTTMHPTLTYAPDMKEQMLALKKMATNQINQHKRTKDYKPGSTPEFYSEENAKNVNKLWNDMLNRLRDLNDMIYETGLQVRNNTTLQADNFVDYNMLNEIESFAGGINPMSSIELLEMLDEMNASDPVFTESLNADGKTRYGMENANDMERNDDIISRLREFGWSSAKTTDSKNKKLRAVMLVALHGGNVADARAFSAQHKTPESLDQALFEMLEDDLASLGGAMSTNKSLLLRHILGATDLSNTNVLLGQQEKQGVNEVIDYMRTLPRNKLTIMESRNGLAAGAPTLTDNVMRPTDILVRELGKQLGDTPMIYYDGRGLDRRSTPSGTFVLVDADNNITGVVVDTADESKYLGQYDDGIAKVAKQILKHTLAAELDQDTTTELQAIQNHLDDVLARPEHADTYLLLKKRLGQLVADLPPAEFVMAMMTDAVLQEAVHKLNTVFDTTLSLRGDKNLNQLVTDFLYTSFHYAEGEVVSKGDTIEEAIDVYSYDATRPDLASFGSVDRAFEVAEARSGQSYENSSILRQVANVALSVTTPKTSEDASLLVENYNADFADRGSRELEKNQTSLKDFIHKSNETERRFEQYKDNLDTPFRPKNLQPIGDAQLKSKPPKLTTLDEKWDAVNGKGEWSTLEAINDADLEYAENVMTSYEGKVETQLKVKMKQLDVDIARYSKALDAYYKAKDDGDTIPAIVETKSQEFIALREQAFRDRKGVNDTLQSSVSQEANAGVDLVYKKAAIEHYTKRMAAHRQQARKDSKALQSKVSSLTDYDLRDGTVGVAKLREMMKESGASLDLTRQREDDADFDALWSLIKENILLSSEITPVEGKLKDKKKPRIFVFDTASVAGEETYTPSAKIKPVSALSAPGATVSVVKAANKLQLDVRNKMYQNDSLYRNLVDTDPNDSVLQNYDGLIASMSQTYADPRTTTETKAAAATVLEMAIKGKHQPVFTMGNEIMANTISEDAAKTMLAGVYTKFRKRVWNHRASVVDTVLSQDKTANDYGHDIFARVDLGLRGTDGRNGYKRELAQLKQVLEPLEAKMGKKKATEAYVSSLIGSVSDGSKGTPYEQVQHTIQELKAGLAFNQSFVDSLSPVRRRGKVAAEIRAQIAPAKKAIKKAESMLVEEGFDIQAFDAAMLEGMSTSQKMFVQNAREYFAKKLPALQLITKLDGKKDMGTFDNYLPWRTFDVDNPQGPDVGFNDLEPEQTLDSHSNYLGKRFSGDQANGIDLNPLRAILAVANTTAYQTNTKFSNEHFANVFGDESHDSQFKEAVKHYDKGAKQQEKLNLLNEVMAEEIRTTINNDLRATKHDNWFFRGTDLAAATGFRVSLSSVEQPFLQTLPVLGAYGARDPGKAAKVSEVLTKLVATTPMKAASKLTGGEANTYADYVDTLLRYAAPELHAREVNGINEMKDVIDKVRLSDLEGIIDKVTFAPKSLYSIINTTHEWFLKASTGAPDSMLIRAIWAANYEHATGQKIDKDSVANLNVTAAFNATRAAEGEMALSDGSTKSQLFQQAENGGVEFFRRSLIVFSNHLMSLAPNVSAAKAMLKSDDAAMKAEGKKRIADFVLQTVLFNGLKMKNLAFAVAYMTTRGIDDEDERYDAFMKRQEKLLGFAHNYAGFNERRPMDMSDYAWSMGVKSALELTGVATPWASIAAINGTASSMVKQVAKDVYGIRAPGTGDRYMKEIEGFINMFGAPGFGLNAFLQLDAVHRTAQHDYEFNMDHLALMYLSFGGPREMRQRMMDKVRKNTGASEWNKSYGKKIDMPFYDHTPSNFKSHDAPLAPTDFKYEKPTADEWAMAEFTPPKSYKLEKMDWLNREGASYIDGDSGVMKNGFLSYFYPRMMGVDTLESTDKTNINNSQLRDQAASLNLSKQQAMDFGRKAAHDTYMTLKDQDVYVSHNEEKVHGGRRTWAHILIKKGDKYYNVGSLSLIKGYALPLGNSNTRDRKLNNYAKRNKRGFYADKAK